MPTSGYDVIALMAERLVAEGCSPAQVAIHEQRLTNLLAAALKERKRREDAEAKERRDAVAAQLIHLGPGVACERLGVRRSTVYKMLSRYRARLRRRAETEQA